VRFLAVLELYKQGLVDLDQVDTFGELDRRLAGPATTTTTTGDLAFVDAYDG
jgi:chromatin segregation and condensation protein Rec8/ScpA/Scc1 (kleisin family)